MNKGPDLVIGLDFGTDSCRAVLVDAGPSPVHPRELFSAVADYPRWSKGLYCDAATSRFRQHPQDYLEAIQVAFDGLLAQAGPGVLSSVRAVAIDTTASTPCAVDQSGTPLSLLPAFADDPDAMFVLWKDHTATAEAELVNETARTWGGPDYTRFEGGVYSAEWFWAKVLRIVRTNHAVADAAVSFVEHGDWMAATLTGCTAVADVRRSRCAMGHKALWHQLFGGYPSDDFMRILHPALPRIKASLGTMTHTSDTVAGRLTDQWASALHLPGGIPVMVGSIDAHVGAVGGGAAAGVLVKVMGTSTCDMIVARHGEGDETVVRGICGQVDGSIVPGWTGYEAGQSAFGDVYAWFRELLSWPVTVGLKNSAIIDEATRARVQLALEQELMERLSREASLVDPEASGVLALDWLNGRRTPDADQRLKAAIAGLSLGTNTPAVFRALVEATAFGSRAIVERFVAEGLSINRIVAVGGVARRSPFVVQTVADVLGMPVDVLSSEQTVALGAAMIAAVGAGLYGTVEAAQAAMQPPVERTFVPEEGKKAAYDRLYSAYLRLGSFVEQETRRG